MAVNDPLAQISAAGVSVWLDDLARSRLAGGGLAAMVADRHVVGVTTNPTIFDNAITSGASDYAEQLHDLAIRDVPRRRGGARPHRLRRARRLRRAAPGARAPGGHGDGRVSIEVDPRLARDTEATIAEARALWWAVDRPNLLIKIPATVEGLPAITQVLAEGISVNVTLIFSVERYRAVLDAWLAGLERRPADGHDVSGIASVASFFVSRVDTEVDERLDALGTPEAAAALRGKAAIANARLRLGRLRGGAAPAPGGRRSPPQGAHPQRPLWASTGVKDPQYDDTRYVIDLVGAGVRQHDAREDPRRRRRPRAVIRGDTVSGTAAAAAAVLGRPRGARASAATTSSPVLEDEGVDEVRGLLGSSCSPPWTRSLDRRPRRRRADDVADHRRDPGRQPAARPARPAAAPHRRPVRHGHLRRHRRPGPQEGHAGDLRPGQPWAAAARASRWSASPGGTGPTRTSPRSSTTRCASTPAPSSARTSGQQLSKGIRFVAGDFADDDAFDELRRVVDELDDVRGTRGNHAFYLSIPPGFFPVVVQQLKRSGLSASQPGAWRRVVIEKPFGHDLASAQELNAVVGEVFPPGSVFRIDHYLGKETVQNILAIRFANTLFEPIWNGNYVDHVQITMAEDIGIGGRAGLLRRHRRRPRRDPEPPPAAAGAHRDGGAAVASTPSRCGSRRRRCSPRSCCRRTSTPTPPAGQYAEGWQGGVPVKGYLQEDGIPADSTTETYAAIRLDVDTRRWAGVPFYLRTGKRLGRRVTEVAVVFKRAPHLPFAATATEELSNNALVFRIQPDEGITVRFGSKVPGTGDGGARRHHGLPVRRLLHRDQPGGVRAPHPRRPAGRPAAVPPARGGRARLAHPRPDPGALGGRRAARAVLLRWLGAAGRLRDDRARRRSWRRP